ncbi:DUF2188 domain-containing protein [Tetragenococcus halophilus]|uniref:DUF2188 domain-containing protein n=1 Tax=Tetragenococcus halophilus TaxID=51669 RepID=A0AB37D400_TETHA|nr:DUF2188 domain-containing protein [Tetragenococcus halophilus]MCO8286031.1 DUF2188 domain-containing protein [Tetragenococcus halophilus]QGP75992.1 DUF2188 domain-containing protein [Tetragenococcus halophilus]GMG60955.1 DUF2188 domain-containing protein [Tetragenococcus halophilus]GMG64582.1 DUF2188 domain-containing protein [Tetragenococcus halophilus]GMG68020.1 DUF2188 domain-containing protein [Tetragenococcus halophilus]
MVWDMNDYPSTMKNLDSLVRKKAIDIANALLQDGYPEGRAIPIATKQAQQWYNNASSEEKTAFRQEKPPQKNDSHAGSKRNKKLLDANVKVNYSDKQWQVISKGAKKASETYDTKEKAIERAKYIAQNKETSLEIYKENGDLQETRDFSK